MSAEASVRSGAIRAFVVPAAAVTVGVGALALLPRVHAAPTTYASVSTMAAIADLAAGLVLLIGAAVVSLARPGHPAGVVALLCGIAWFAGDAVGWAAGPDAVRTIAMVAAPFLLPLVAHLAVLVPRAHFGSAVGQAVRVAYVLTVVVSLGWALFRDPFRDRGCWSNCTANDLLVVHVGRAADALDLLWLALVLGVGSGLVALAAWRWSSQARSTSPSDPPGGLALASGAVFGLAAVGWVVAMVLRPIEDPADPVFASLFVLRASAVVGLGSALLAMVLVERRRRSAVLRLAADIGDAPQPGALQRALAAALGDPTLTVAYWLADRDVFVDADGDAVSVPASEDGRVTTAIVRRDEIVAMITHDITVPSADVTTAIGAAARLAVDNERLGAAVRAELADLRRSRQRIVETGDAERQRLERNLHDGAQQQLLALAYEIRRAHTTALDDGVDREVSLLADASAGTQAAIDDLRTLAHGIFPAMLVEAGLRPALESLAEFAPIPVEIGDVPDGRCPEAVELAAYRVALAAIADATGAPEAYVRLGGHRDDGTLVFTVDRHGGQPAAAADEVADRVGAAGGRLTLEHADGVWSTRVELPCG
jgi:signal transduction histidine kinase